MEQRPATVRPLGRGKRPVRAVFARPLKLNRGMTLEEAFRVTLLECLAHIAANVTPVCRERDAEALHQLRVGLRRLNVALTAFGQTFRTPAMLDLRRRAKAFAQAVAPARDLDVFVTEQFLPVAARFGHDDAFRLLAARAEEARRAAWDRAVEHIAGSDFAQFQDEVAALAQAGLWPTHPGVTQLGPHLAARAPVVPVAAHMLDSYRRKVRKRGRRLKMLEHRDCHRLRIALKKLRYAAEFYAPLFGHKRPRRYLSRLRGLQEVLGAFNDTRAVQAILARLTGDASLPHVEADLKYAAGLVTGWHRARAEQLGKKAVKRWKRFKRYDPFWA